MKKIFLTFVFILSISLVACSSPETDELVEYHNNYVGTVNEKAMLVDAELQNSLMAESPEKALEMQKNNVLPLVDEIEEFIRTREPETDVVKELHQMRVEQLETWIEGVLFRYQALEKTVEDASVEEINELIKKSDEKIFEAQQKGKKADDRFLEMAEEYDVVLQG